MLLVASSCSRSPDIEIGSQALVDSVTVRYLARREWEMSVPVRLEIYDNNELVSQTKYISYEQPSIFHDGLTSISISVDHANGVFAFLDSTDPQRVLCIFERSTGKIYPGFEARPGIDWAEANALLKKYAPNAEERGLRISL